MSYATPIRPVIYNVTVEADTGPAGNYLEWDSPLASILIAHIDGPIVYIFLNDSEQSFPLDEGDTLAINSRDLHITKVAFGGLSSGGDDTTLSIIAGVQQ